MSGGAGGQGVSFEDTLWLLGLGVAAVAFGVIDPAGMATSALGWLVEHRVLVSREQALVPLFADTGLDLRRLVGVAAAVVLASLLAARHHRRSRAAAMTPAGGRA